MTSLARLLAAPVALALFACGAEPRADAPPARPANAPRTVAAAPPADLAEKSVDTTIPIGGPDLVTAVRVAGADGADLRRMPAGAPIRVHMDTRPLPAGYVGRVLLRNGARIVGVQADAAEGARALELALDRTADLDPGAWTIEVWLGGEKVEERTIAIVDLR